MTEQFFGKPFRIVLASLAVVFLAAVLVFKTAWTGPALVVIAVGAFILTVKRLEWGLAAAFAELFANSLGHLIDAPLLGFSFSLREAVFLGVMLGWLFLVARRRTALPLRDARLAPFIPLAAAVALGFALGFIRHGPKAAFEDGKAYLYALYVLPVLSVRWTDAARRLLLQALSAGAAWVSFLTLGLLYAYTHLPNAALAAIYAFFRDTRTAELTRMGGIFRVFLQAQLSVFALLVLVSAAAWTRAFDRRRAWRWIALAAVLWSVVVIGLSRSFWLGLGAAALVVIGLFAPRPLVAPRRRTWKAAGLQAAALAGGLAILAAVVLFPFPRRTSSAASLSDAFMARTTDLNDVAVSSRWNLLPAMMRAILVSPISGSGFGQTVTFKTDDPRVRAVHPDGTWTTDAFEWGWLDLWLKMGLLGPFAFLVLLGGVWNGLKPLLATDRAWLGAGLFAAVVMVYVTHALSPYLNNPLGLGLLLFTVPFWTEGKRRASEAVAPKPVAADVRAAASTLAAEAE